MPYKLIGNNEENVIFMDMNKQRLQELAGITELGINNPNKLWILDVGILVDENNSLDKAFEIMDFIEKCGGKEQGSGIGFGIRNQQFIVKSEKYGESIIKQVEERYQISFNENEDGSYYSIYSQDEDE